MNFDLNVSISAFTVFFQGILSFLSPCVLPVIPLYIAYLSGGVSKNENGELLYNQKKVIINSIFFVLGISFAFLLLGLGFSALGQFFSANQTLLSQIGGVIIIIFGLIQLGLLSKPFGGKEFKLPFKIDTAMMNPFTALLMGFTFSFAWTPCVGPALSSVLIIVSANPSYGLLLMALYTIGFILPFLLMGFFTTKVINFFKNHGNIVKYTAKVGGALMIVFGLLMLTGLMNPISGYFASLGNNGQVQDNDSNVTTQSEDTSENTEEEDVIPAYAFNLVDQDGNTHSLSDYRGKIVFLNFWGTWCPHCISEMGYIQELYEEMGYNKEEVVFLGMALPNDENRFTSEGSTQDVATFLSDNGYTYPTLMDMNGDVFENYFISAYPTTFLIDENGNIFGYITGSISKETMEDLITRTKNGER